MLAESSRRGPRVLPPRFLRPSPRPTLSATCRSARDNITRWCHGIIAEVEFQRGAHLRRVCFPHTMLTGNCQWCIMVHPSTSSTAGSLDKPWLVAVVTSSLTRTDQPKGSERTIETTWSMRRTVVLHGFRFSWAELGFENRMEGICPENFRCWLSGASYSTL